MFEIKGLCLCLASTETVQAAFWGSLWLSGRVGNGESEGLESMEWLCWMCLNVHRQSLA